ncbi:MAG: hypothetical protein V3W34_04230 [Phycisphaerae bacterium]
MQPVNGTQEQIEFLISQYLDGTLDETARRGLEKRLKRDVQLARTLEAYRAVDGLVREWGGDVPEPDWSRFDEEFQRRRAALDRPAGGNGLIFRLFVPAAAAAALIALFVFLQDPLGVTTGLPEVMVRIGRPMPVPRDDEDAYVSYSREAGVIVDRIPMVIAQAAVGRHVRFPTIDSLRSKQ